MRENGIQPALLQDVILTHMHADHAGGLLPLLYAHPVRVRLHSFTTIYNAFVRNTRVLQPGADVRALCDFVPVTVGRPHALLGAMWHFDFAFHTLPTLRFQVAFGGKSVAYSGDTLYEPVQLCALAERGVFSPARLASLLNFVFAADVIVHEAGVPPIHTPVAALDALPDAVKERLLVVHCAPANRQGGAARAAAGGALRVAAVHRARAGHPGVRAGRHGGAAAVRVRGGPGAGHAAAAAAGGR